MGCALACRGQTGNNTYSSHFTAIFAYVYTLHKTPGHSYPHPLPMCACSLLQGPPPFLPLSHLPGFALHPSRGAQRLSISVTISQTWKGTLAARKPHPCNSNAWEGATITPLSRNTGRGCWCPGAAESPHRASATRALLHSRHQTVSDLVDGEQEEVFCCSCPHTSAWWTLLPLQYLNETSGCLTPSKPEIFVTKWIKRSLVSAAVSLLTFQAVL